MRKASTASTGGIAVLVVRVGTILLFSLGLQRRRMVSNLFCTEIHTEGVCCRAVAIEYGRETHIETLDCT